MEYFRNLWAEFSLVTNLTKLNLVLDVLLIILAGFTGTVLIGLIAFVVFIINIAIAKKEIELKKLELSK